MLHKINARETAMNCAVASARETVITDWARELMNLHQKYGHLAHITGESVAIEEWFTNKGNENGETITAVLSKHPNWNPEKKYIVFSHEFEREIDSAGYRMFWRKIKRFAYDNGISNYVIDEFEENLYMAMSSTIRQTLDKNAEIYLKEAYPELKAKEGMKVSRLVNRFMCSLGLDKFKATETRTRVDENGNFYEETREFYPYNRIFDEFAQSVNPTKQKRWVVFSVNPIDFATMSFGNSWASCHTIDKANRRHSSGTHYHGMYCGGTMSYMMDKSSIVVYTVDGSYNGNDYEYQDKMTRQMVHFDGKGAFVQSRLYPQSCDGGTDLYKVYREIEQKVFAKCLGANNSWKYKNGTNIAERIIFNDCNGHHYPDWQHFSSVGVCVLKEKAETVDEYISNGNYINVGHYGIDIYDGGRLSNYSEADGILSTHLCCGKCGAVHDLDDMHEVNGEYYCDDCCFFCDYCDCYEFGEPYVTIEGRWGTMNFCDYGADRERVNGNIFYCDDCGTWYAENNDNYGYTADGCVICENCLENYNYSDHDGFYIPESESVYIESENDYRQIDDCEQCESCREWFLSSDVVNCRCENCQ